jgi:peptidoglycan-associated lipoprotein
MRLKFLIVVLSAALLAACSSDRDSMGTSSGAGTTASTTGTTSGSSQPSVSSESVGGPTAGSQEDLLVNVGDRVFFGYDRSDLSPQAQQTAETLAAWLRQYPSVTITIEGHCDERGTRDYNLALGERRASSVRDYLVALGIDGNRMTTISYGKERPAVLGSNEDAWAQNRRAVFVVN